MNDSKRFEAGGGIPIGQIAEEYKGEWVALWVTEWADKDKKGGGTAPLRAIVIAHDAHPYKLREATINLGAAKEAGVNIVYADRLLPMLKTEGGK